MKRGLLAIGAFAAIPMARLVANNPSEPLPLARFTGYWAAVVLSVAALLLVVRRVRPSDVDRVAAASAMGLFAVGYLAVALRSAFHLPSILAVDGSVWLAGGLILAAVLVSRSGVVQRSTPLLAVVLLLYPVVEVMAHSVGGDPSRQTIGSEPLEVEPGARPNIYWIVTDGYTGPDVLEHEYGYSEEGAFVSDLERRGFVVADRALAAYPMTHLSMSSTMSMDYLVDSSGNVGDPEPFYETAQGDNTLVATLRSWGYEFDLYPGGLYAASQCTGREDVCLTRVSVDPGDWALLSMTPIASLIKGPWTAARQADYSNPLSILEALDTHVVSEPRFVMAHILSPHPPFYRSGADCQVEDVTFNLGAPWGPPEAYVGAVRCLNVLLEATVDEIIDEDPDAVIVIQGDHGPNLGIAFEQGHDPTSWTDEQIRVRFNVLSAMRLPDGCAVPDPTSLVNTFRVVLGCLAGRDIPLQPIRTFTVNSHPGDVAEIEPPL